MQQLQPIVMNAFTSPLRNILLGGALCYAVQKNKYLHIPIIFLTPSIYAGYHLFENKAEVLNFISTIKKNSR